MNPTATSRQLSRRAALGLGAATGVLLWLSFFPANLGFVSWFALVPLLVVVYFASNRVAQLAAWSAALVFYVPVLSWMSVAHSSMIAAWLFLSVYCSFFFAFTVWLLWRVDRQAHWPLTLSVPIVWTAGEFFRGRLFGGFAWYLLGHAQHDVPALLQIVDVGGELTLTFVVAAVNGLFADALIRPRLSVRKYAVAVLLLVIACFGYGSWRLRQGEFSEGPRVALLQGNISQDLRNEVSQQAAEEQGRKDADFIHRHYVALTRRAASAQPDLCIWPETSLPESLTFLAPNVGLDSIPMPRRLWIEQTKEELSAIGRAWGFAHLLGATTWELGPDSKMTHFNSAVLVDGQGVYRQRYDKIHRVPFGEFVPLGDTLPWLIKLTPYEEEYAVMPGREHTRFQLESGGRKYLFGTLICYEDADGPLAREYLASPAVDFFVNISNDGWFKGSREHEQHLAVARFRAVECRRAVVRAVNMGISAVIDPNGRITHLPGPTWKASKAIDGVVVARVPIDNRTSIYAIAGDWLPWACWIALLVMNFWPRRP